VIDASIRRLIDPPLAHAGQRLAAAGISADAVQTGRLPRACGLPSSRLCSAPVAPLGGALSDRLGPRLLTVAGMLTCVAALALLFAVLDGAPTSLPPAVLALAIFGTGQGLFISPNNSANRRRGARLPDRRSRRALERDAVVRDQCRNRRRVLGSPGASRCSRDRATTRCTPRRINSCRQVARSSSCSARLPRRRQRCPCHGVAHAHSRLTAERHELAWNSSTSSCSPAHPSPPWRRCRRCR
jgi:hypothetical protein